MNNRGGQQPQAQHIRTAQQPPVNNYTNKPQPPQFANNQPQPRGGAFNNTDNYVNVAAAAAASEKSYIGGGGANNGGNIISGSSVAGHGYGDLQENIYANVDPEQQYLNRTSR